MATEPFPELKDSSRAALMRIARLLSSGFTGRIVIDATQGGVGNFEQLEKMDSRALVKREGQEAA